MSTAAVQEWYRNVMEAPNMAVAVNDGPVSALYRRDPYSLTRNYIPLKWRPLEQHGNHEVTKKLAEYRAVPMDAPENTTLPHGSLIVGQIPYDVSGSTLMKLLNDFAGCECVLALRPHYRKSRKASQPQMTGAWFVDCVPGKEDLLLQLDHRVVFRADHVTQLRSEKMWSLWVEQRKQLLSALMTNTTKKCLGAMTVAWQDKPKKEESL